MLTACSFACSEWKDIFRKSRDIGHTSVPAIQRTHTVDTQWEPTVRDRFWKDTWKTNLLQKSERLLMLWTLQGIPIDGLTE
ncbi:hypothetical protein GN956_G6788 [Arapaima gigas]